jgi:hypothetical protein
MGSSKRGSIVPKFDDQGFAELQNALEKGEPTMTRSRSTVIESKGQLKDDHR